MAVTPKTIQVDLRADAAHMAYMTKVSYDSGFQDGRAVGMLFGVWQPDVRMFGTNALYRAMVTTAFQIMAVGLSRRQRAFTA